MAQSPVSTIGPDGMLERRRELRILKASFGVSAPITVGIIIAAAAVCMAVAAGVAWGATRVRPIEVLRYE